MLRNIFLTLAASVALAVSALDVTTTPGGLKTAVGDAAASATSLTVSGSIDYSDLRFVAEEMPALSSLDLSGATIAAYAGSPLDANRSEFAANEIPEYGLLGANFKTISLPAGITAIGEGAFAGNSSLTSISIPATVTSMGASAFSDCTALASATVAAAIAELPASTFSGCSALSSVSLPAGLTTIGQRAFSGTSALKSITFPAALTTIAQAAFYGSDLLAANLAATNLTTIGPWAFAECDNLAALSLPSSIATIAEGAFFANASLNNFEYPTNLTTVADYAFTGDDALNANNFLHADITSIGDYAIADWSNVSTVDLPTKLAWLGSGAMANWTSVEEINATLIAAVPELGDNVWEDVNQANVRLKVMPSLVDAYRDTPQWSEFDITAGGEQGIIDSEDGLATNAKVWFEGNLLHVEADGPIAGVVLYDLAGRAYVLNVPAAASVFTADTSAWEGNLFIVRVAFADMPAATFKLAR